MRIEKKKDGAALMVSLAGRLDTVTALELEAALSDLEGVQELVLELGALEHTSSAGLRALLLLHKKMAAQGKMKLKNVTPAVLDVLKMANFTKFLTIEA
ncbi:MAG: STAS domain-containing protein [Synergistaceae bacterium]|nr:STAS domain-containing protein [Synergistaceae bacterium]